MNICKGIYYSFIMVCYNQINITIQAIETLALSLETDMVEKGVEIILVDNGSIVPMEVSRFKNINGNIKLEVNRLNNNLGYPVGMNYGISKCSGKVIILVNNDLIFTKGWLSTLLETLESDSDIGLVAPLLSNASGSQHLDFYSSDILEIHAKAKEVMNLKQSAYETNRVIGACMVVRKEVIESVGGNDFWFGPGYYDDDDLCLRIRIAGFKIMIVRSSFVYHIGSASFLSNDFSIIEIIKNHKYKFLRKWQLETIEERAKVLERNCYFKDDYFIPVREKEFLNRDSTVKMSGVLIVADWSSQTSDWSKALNKLMSKQKTEKFYLWWPSNYFEPINEPIPENFHLIAQPVPHIRMLQFIKQFSGILKIENDYINAYLIEIAQLVSLNIINWR